MSAKSVLGRYARSVRREAVFSAPRFYDPGDATAPDRIMSVATANVGLGNPRWCDIISGLAAVCAPEYAPGAYDAGMNTWVFGELADTESRIGDWLSGLALRKAHINKALHPDPEYNSLDGYLRQRGELGRGNIAKARIGGQMVFGAFARKIGQLAGSAGHIDMIFTQELPAIALKNYIGSINKARKRKGLMPVNNIRTGIYIPDTVEKPGIYRLNGFLDFVWLTSTFQGSTDYGRYIGAYRGKTGMGLLEEMVGAERIIRGTPLPADVSASRGRTYTERWYGEQGIEAIVRGFAAHDFISLEEMKNSYNPGIPPIKIGIIPSGSGICPEYLRKILDSFEPYLKRGFVEITCLCTQPEDKKVAENREGVRIIANANRTVKEKKELIDNSYRIMEGSHAVILPPGEQPSVAEALGLPIFLYDGRGYNEERNADYYARMHTGMMIRCLESAADQIVGAFIGQVPSIMAFRDVYRSTGYLERYGLAAEDSRYTLPAECMRTAFGIFASRQ